MTIDSHALNSRRDRRAARALVVIAALLAPLFSGSGYAQAPAAAGGVAAPMSAAELETLVAPIALYPDDLVAIILPAATNPLQLVQAGRYLDRRKADPKAPVDENWDDAVKSLLNYPEVVKKMSTDLDWTVALGEAVVADQGGVLEAIQVFRRKTQAVGNLKSDDKQVIVVEKEVIKIVPANPQVIYVPQYNPSTVVVYGGYSSWGYWPSPYPVYYYPYPPGAAFATGLIWGAAISAAWHGNHYVTHYGGYGGQANININRNVNVNRNVNINRPGGPIATPAATQWTSNKQPGQVSGTVGRSVTRVGSAQSTAATTSTAAARSATRAAPSTASTGAAPQQRGAAATGGQDRHAGRSSALDASGSGRQAQLDSARGAASRETRSAGGQQAGGGRAAASTPSGAGRTAAPTPAGGGRTAAPQRPAGGARGGAGGGRR